MPQTDKPVPDDSYQSRLIEAGRAVTQACQSAKYQGPAIEGSAYALLQMLKLVEQLGVELGELRDDFAQAQRDAAAAAVGRDFADLSALVDSAQSVLATPSDEIIERFRQIKDPAAAIVDPQGVELAAVTRTDTVISLTGANAARLVEAARRAGVTPVEFATAAVLRAVDTVMGPKL